MTSRYFRAVSFSLLKILLLATGSSEGAPKSHNGLRSPHRSVPVHRGMDGTYGWPLRDSALQFDGSLCPWRLRTRWVCTHSPAIVIEMSWRQCLRKGGASSPLPNSFSGSRKHSRKMRRPEGNLWMRQGWIAKAAFPAKIDDQVGIINYAKSRTERAQTEAHRDTRTNAGMLAQWDVLMFLTMLGGQWITPVRLSQIRLYRTVLLLVQLTARHVTSVVAGLTWCGVDLFFKCGTQFL